MRSIDFSHPGGFPLTQEGLDHLQQAYTECLNALGAMGGHATVPAIISGMSRTYAGSTVIISSGWFYYGGTLIKFDGGSVAPTGADVPVIRINTDTTTLTYNDGSTYPAMSIVTASLIAGPISITATQFPYLVMQPYQYFFGLGGRETNWNSIVVNTTAANGGVSGTIYYKKNWLTNTLTLQATLTANNAQNFAASPSAANYIMGVLPPGYLPTTVAYFTTHYYAAGMFRDDLGVSWVKQLMSAVNTGGQIYINFIRPDAAVPAYSVTFNTIIPLD